MTLHDYLISRRISEAAFADQIGISQSAVNRMRNGSLPLKDVAARIMQATDGLVQPNDFYGVTT